MKNVIFQKEKGVALLQIERPEALNALSKEIVDQIGNIVREIQQDEEIRVLLIYSKKNFAAGADIQDMAECDDKEAMDFVFSPVFNRIEKLPIPTIAAIEGYALGGGLELALACDIRMAAENAKLGFPEINLGIMPGAGGTVRAPRCVGCSAAMELIFSGETITAQRAMQIGLISRMEPEQTLFDSAYKFAEKLASKAPVALRTAKKTICEGLEEPSVEKAIEKESRSWASLFTTQDQKEKMKAFLEKKKRRNP